MPGTVRSSTSARSATDASSAPFRSLPSASTKCLRAWAAGNHVATLSLAQTADCFAWQPLHAFGAPNRTLRSGRGTDRAAPSLRRDANARPRRSARAHGSGRTERCPTRKVCPSASRGNPSSERPLDTYGSGETSPTRRPRPPPARQRDSYRREVSMVPVLSKPLPVMTYVTESNVTPGTTSR
jgi:hypothetical protein